MLRHFGTSSLQGTGVTLEIQEVEKGRAGDHHIIVDNLDAGIAHFVRIRALNDYGYGPYTTLSQTLGSGAHLEENRLYEQAESQNPAPSFSSLPASQWECNIFLQL